MRTTKSLGFPDNHDIDEVPGPEQHIPLELPCHFVVEWPQGMGLSFGKSTL